MTDVCMMFCVVQPPFKGKKRPLANNYIEATRLSLSTLIRTGFPREKIICFTPDEKHVRQLKKWLKINVIQCKIHVPKVFRYWLNKSSRHFYLYKPLIFSQMMPKPINDDTVMVFSDIDIMWQKNPFDLLANQSVDVWTSRGTHLPRRKNNPSARYKKWMAGKKPQINKEELTEYYYKVGNVETGKMMAEVQLKYGFPIPDNHLYLFTGTVAVKPSVYTKLIAQWYEMCYYYANVSRGQIPEIGDQETFAAATWHLGLSNGRGGKEVGGYIKHYGGDRKKDMKVDYKKYCKKIDTRRKKRLLKEKNRQESVS